MPLRTNPYEKRINWQLAVGAISVLGPLGVQAKNKNAIRNGAILGGIGLGVSATAIYFAMERNFEIVRKYP